jgi:hypothetical protein
LRVSTEAHSVAGITWAIQSLASVAAGRDDARLAARLLGFCDARCGTVHAPRQADQCEDIAARRLRVRLATALAPEILGGELEAGALLGEEDATVAALSIE